MYYKTLVTLEYAKVLAAIRHFTDSSLASKQAEQLPIYKDITLANVELSKVQEAFDLLYVRSVRPSFAIENIASILEKARIFSTLSIADILKVRNNLRAGRIIKHTIEQEGEAGLPLLNEIVFDMLVDKKLEEDINNAVLSETELKDTASNELFNIRKSIKKISDNIRKKLKTYITSPNYKNIIQDNIVTIRNERFVIPVKPEQRGSLPGLVHDQSASKQTVYIEPMEVVELNNDLRLQQIAEAAETERILAAFTNRIAGIANMLEQSLQSIVALDIIFAKAKYAEHIKAIRPELNDKHFIQISGARHPLINKDIVVPNEVLIGKEYNVLLITGPNTGGKTVYLKTVGLLQLMAQSGIFVPAKSANCGIFDNIFCDIGDEQSIEQSLSTFSSHIVNIIHILENISPQTLVLLDELGAGTDPSEGAGLAVALTEHLLASKARVFITTHYSELKEYAIASNGIENACMDFEANTYSPTFKLLIGTPGSSNALIIAEKLGLDSNIIEKARLRLAPHKAELEKMIKELERSKKAAIEAQEQAFWNLQKSKEELKLAKNERATLNLKREKLEAQWAKEKKEYLRDTIEDAQQIIESLKQTLENPSESKLFEGRKLVAGLKKQLHTKIDYELLEGLGGEIEAGDWVYIKPLRAKGKVEEISAKKGELKVNLSGITSNVKLADCVKVEAVTTGKTAKVANISFSPKAVSGELNLIGKNADEAIYELSIYLDRAYLAGYGEVSIIHGRGSGRLRSATREYLNQCAFVKEYRDGIYGEGERGVTVVKFR